jgi:hypothetical protein
LSNNLFNAFNEAKKRFTEISNGFGCERITNTFYIGVDRSKFPVVLFQVSQLPQNFVPIQTRALSVDFLPNCIVNFRENTVSGDFICLSCTSLNSDLHNTFFRLTESFFLLENQFLSVAGLIESLENLVFLFQKLFDPPKNNIVGLFGELLLINESRSTEKAVKSWHSKCTDLMDFAWSSGRLEVKTTSTQARLHEFSLEQLRPIPDLSKYIASVNVQEVYDGVSVIDLLDSVLAKVKSPELINKIWGIVFDTLGQSYIRSDLRKFDYLTAKKSLKFFNAISVPSPNFNLPPGVSSVRFIANIDQTNGVNEADLKLLSDAGLF